MKQYIKTGSRILFNYLMALIVFVIFIYVFMSITKDNFGKLLPLYSILIFLFLFYILYMEVKSIAVKEKRPQNEMKPYPLKGLVYGLVAIIPIAVPVGVVSLIPFGSMFAERIKHLAINSILGPMYFLIKWLNESVAGYAAALLLIPFISMLAYLAGYYGIEIMGKLKKKKALPEKGFTKSPWNPTNAPVKKTGKKKGSAK